jgi:hypothetical protein
MVFSLAVVLSLVAIAAEQPREVSIELSGTEIALIITALSSLAGVLGGIVVQIRGQNEARKARLELSKKMDEVKTTVVTATDGVVTKLGAAKLAQGTAEGHAAGLQQGRAEDSK